MDFRNESVADIAQRVQGGQVSAREITQAALDRIAELNGKVNAFVAVDADLALAQASSVDQKLRAGEEVGPLAGVPVGVKDLEDAAGFVTTHGSRIHADDPPATTDSVLVDRIRQAGAVIVGKTNTPEYGFKADTTNPLFGGTGNPWNLACSAGGSSGGSAAAVAAGMVPLCTASDGGGSIRIPASLCGLPGFKPSLGRIPMGDDEPPTWGDMSTRGLLTRDVRDLAYCLDTVIGPYPRDLRSLPMPEQSWVDAMAGVHLPRRVAWSPTLGYGVVDAEVAELCEAAVGKLRASGVDVVEVPEVFPEDPVWKWLSLAALGSLRYFERFRGTPKWDLIDPEQIAIMELVDANVSKLDVLRAQDEAHLLNLRLVDLFHRASFLLLPTVAGQTGPVGGVGIVNGEPNYNWVYFTYPFNLTRSPAGTVPAGFTRAGMPVGLQIVGPQHADVAVLRAMAAIHDTLGFDALAPIA